MTYRVLHTLPALDGGGAERIVYDYVSRMSNSYTFDFIVHTRKKGILEEFTNDGFQPKIQFLNKKRKYYFTLC